MKFNNELETGKKLEITKSELPEANENNLEFHWKRMEDALAMGSSSFKYTLNTDAEIKLNSTLEQNVYIEGECLEALKCLQKNTAIP